jgi:uncharacterized membrane protein YebE (DUF533 family)
MRRVCAGLTARRTGNRAGDEAFTLWPRKDRIMTLRSVLGTMLASRMAGRGGRRGGGLGAGLGSAAMLGMLGGRRRGGLGGKVGLAALGYMAYQAYQDRQAPGAGAAGEGRDTGSGGGFSGIVGNLAERFGIGGGDGQSTPAPETAPAAGPTAEDRQAAESFSDEKALLLIRGMIAAAHSDGQISPVERTRIVQQLQAGGADAEDRRVVEREMEAPRGLDELVAEARRHDLAQEFYLASRAAIDGESEAHRAYLADLRQRLGLSEAEAAEIEGLAS